MATDMPSELDILSAYRNLVSSGSSAGETSDLTELLTRLYGTPLNERNWEKLKKSVLNLAVDKCGQGRFDEAVELLDLILRFDSRHPGSLHLKADILVAKTEISEAAAVSQTILSDNPLDLRAIRRLLGTKNSYLFRLEAVDEFMHTRSDPSCDDYLKCSQYLNEGGLFEYTGLYAAKGLTLALSPNQKLNEQLYKALLLEWGRALYHLADIEKSLSTFENIDRDSGTYLSAVAYRVLCLADLGSFDEAETLFESIVENFEAHKLKPVENIIIKEANKKYLHCRLDEALKLSELVTKSNHDHLAALNLKADILSLRGNKSAASQLSETILNLNPVDLRAIRRLASLKTNYAFKPSIAEKFIGLNTQSRENYLKCAQYLNEGGLLDDAIIYARKGLEAYPSGNLIYEEQHRNSLMLELAQALYNKGRFDEALAVCNQIGPHANVYFKAVAYRILCLVELNLVSEAEAVLHKAVSTSDAPSQINVENIIIKVAKVKLDQWRLDATLTLADLILKSKPGQINALNLKADILVINGNIAGAANLWLEVLKYDPLNIQAIRCLVSANNSYKFERSIAEDFIAVNGPTRENYLKCAVYLNEGDLGEEAIIFARKGLEAMPGGNPVHGEHHRNSLLFEWGQALYFQHKFEELLVVYEQISRHSSTYAGASKFCAFSLIELGRFKEAESLLSNTEGLGENDLIAWRVASLSVLAMQGRFNEAFKIYRLRSSSKEISRVFNSFPPTLINLKSGFAADKTCLFIATGGVGDEIRYAAVYKQLSELTGQMIITCDPRLSSIFERNFPESIFIPVKRYRLDVVSGPRPNRTKIDKYLLHLTLDDSVLQQQCDFACSVLDTLADLRPTIQSFADQTTLIPDKQKQAYWNKIVSRRSRPQIGLCWRSLLTSKIRNIHYLKATDLLSLSDIEADFWILQPNVHEEELAVLKENLNIIIPEIDLIDDFEGQAALMSCLDAVISPLSAIGELSGMFGVRTILFDRNRMMMWRRKDDGSDIWYKQGRFVATSALDNVDALTAKIKTELLHLLTTA